MRQYADHYYKNEAANKYSFFIQTIDILKVQSNLHLEDKMSTGY